MPTEAEWEYACRAGTKTAWHFGDDASRLSDYSWWGGVFGDGNAKTEQYAHGVGLKLANAWGLHDMHGNVWEFCADWYDEVLRGGNDPSGPAVGTDRVVRGGSWYSKPDDARSAFRQRYEPDFRHINAGFRVVLASAVERNNEPAAPAPTAAPAPAPTKGEKPVPSNKKTRPE